MTSPPGRNRQKPTLVIVSACEQMIRLHANLAKRWLGEGSELVLVGRHGRLFFLGMRSSGLSLSGLFDALPWLAYRPVINRKRCSDRAFLDHV